MAIYKAIKGGNFNKEYNAESAEEVIAQIFHKTDASYMDGIKKRLTQLDNGIYWFKGDNVLIIDTSVLPEEDNSARQLAEVNRLKQIAGLK